MPTLHLLPPVTVAETPEEVRPILRRLMKRGGHLAIDTETTGLDKINDRVLFWSMATESERFCFDVSVLPLFHPLFDNPRITWNLANAKYDMHMLKNHGVTLAGKIFDIVVMDAIMDDTRRHGLKAQALARFGIDWGEFKELFLDPKFLSSRIGLAKEGFSAFKGMPLGDKLLMVYDEAPEIVEDYASCDAFYNYKIFEMLLDELHHDELPTDLFDGFATSLDYYNVIEEPITRELWTMERNGFDIDLDYRKKIDDPMRLKMTNLRTRMEKLTRPGFCPDKNEHIAQALFDDDKGFGMKTLWYTKSGAPKTDEPTIDLIQSRLRKDHPASTFLDYLQEYKKTKKLHGTYVVGIEEFVCTDKVSGRTRVHATIRQAGARTSRLSVVDPALQTIPSRNDPYKIRNMFVAPQGQSLRVLDYPQVEFRIAAALAGQESMMDAMRKGWDIHSANAAQLYPEVSYEEIQDARKRKDENLELDARMKHALSRRVDAKALGLGTMYLQGAFTMSQTLGCSQQEAQEKIDLFFSTNEAILALVEDIQGYAHQFGHAHTMLGRKRQFHMINSSAGGLVAQERRQAWNLAIQGSGAEIMKLAILRCGSNSALAQLGNEAVMTVHDELIYRGPTETEAESVRIMGELMADPFRVGPIQMDYPVPLPPDGGGAPCWGMAK